MRAMSTTAILGLVLVSFLSIEPVAADTNAAAPVIDEVTDA